VWLGDLALARGSGGAALVSYRQALRDSADQFNSRVSAGMILAAAMKGNRIPLDLQGPVQFGKHEFTAEQFSALVDDMLARHSADADSDMSAPINDLASWKVRYRKPLAWRMGEKPERSLLPGIDQLQVDWAGRQTYGVVHKDSLLVSNRFELQALDPATLERKWSSPQVAEKVMQGQDWGLIPMRPLVRQSSVVCRQLYQPQPAMVCFDLDTGELVWANRDEDRVFASDPFILSDQLACLTLTRRQQFEAALQLVFLDESTGQVRDTFDVLHVRDSWWVRRCCEVLASDEGLIVVLGGVTAALDGEGQVLWIRESESLPLEADIYSVRQHFRPAVFADSRLLIAQPGVRKIECLDPSSGILLWDRVLPDVEAILGVDQEAAVVQMRKHIASIDIKTGDLLWLREWDDPLLAAHYFSRDGLIVSRLINPDPNRKELCPQLLLLDTNTGNTIQELSLDTLSGAQPRMGPLIAAGNRLITFWGNGQRSPIRELIQIGPP
jgi:outer membrane protein assembly factor BamB